MIDFTECDVIECKNEVEWMAERQKGVGASEAGVILGLSAWSSPVMLWAQKTGKIQSEGIDNDLAEWGHFMEPAAAARYEHRSGRKLVDIGKFTILRSKKWPWLQATLDRIAPEQQNRMFPGAFALPGVVEVKNPTMYGAHRWDEGPPLDYQCQLQAQLAITGFTWGSFAASLPSGKMEIIDCARQPDFIALLVEKTREFWECVQKEKMPTIDGSKWTTEAIKRLHPKDNGEIVELGREFVDEIAALEQHKLQVKEHEEAIRESENRIKAAIGTATYGRIGDVKFSYKTQVMPEHTVKAREFRVLRRVGR